MRDHDHHHPYLRRAGRAGARRVLAAEATRERVAAALGAHRHVLIVGPTDPATNRAGGVSLELFSALRSWFPDACIVNEADGSRTRPFKAPAAHEPVIPPETTLGGSRGRRRRLRHNRSTMTTCTAPSWSPR